MEARNDAYGTDRKASIRMLSSRFDSIFSCAVRTFCLTLRLTVLENASVRVGNRINANLRTSSLHSSNISILLSLADFRFLPEGAGCSGDALGSTGVEDAVSPGRGRLGSNSQITFKVSMICSLGR